MRHALVLLVLAGCGTGIEPVQTGSQRQQINGGVDDLDTMHANTVVSLVGTCTGTLLTSRIILTAAHCVTSPYLPKVEVGAHDVLEKAKPNKVVRLTTPPPDTAYLEEDLALVFLPWDQAILEHARPSRPSFTALADTHSGSLEAAGWSPYDENGDFDFHLSSYRQRATLPGPFVTSSSFGSGPAFSIRKEGLTLPVLNFGDSGGPLFRTLPDGRRDVIGVASAKVDEFTFWTDITRAPNKTWILAHVTEARTPAWLAQHGKADAWIGEVDYYGACNVTNDPDCDHWNTPHDNCPDYPNPDQKDTNDDGKGDVCQTPACPCEPGANPDPDRDRICTVNCAGPAKPIDNCPNVFNPDQLNCNLVAEQVRGAAVLGNACDPVPCASAVPTYETIAHSCNGTQFSGGFCTTRNASTGFDTERFGPQVRDLIHKSYPVPPIKVTGLETELRYCAENPPAGFVCLAPANVRDSALLDFADHASETLDPARPWHRIRYGKINEFSGDFYPSAWGDTMVRTHGTGPLDFPFEMLYLPEDDLTWLTAGIVPQPWCPTPLSTCRTGSLWLHTNTEIGNTQSTVDGTNVGFHGSGLANSYTAAPIWYDVRKFYAPKIPRKFDFLYRFRDLVDPAPWYRNAWEYASQPIIGVQGQVYVLGPNQRAFEAQPGERFSDSLLNSMKSQTRWLDAQDPVQESDVVAIALSSDGRALLNAAVLRNGKLVTAAEAGLTLSSQLVPPTTAAPVSSFFVNETSSVYRVTEGRDLWRFKLGTGWSKTQLASSIAPLLAAVYSTADKNIWALDQPDSRTVRLLRISGAQVTELARTAKRTDVTQYFMSLDENGSVVVTTVAPARTVVTRVQTGLRYELMSRNQLATTLQQPPASISDGFLLISFDAGASSWSVDPLAGAAPAQSLASIY